MTHLPPIATTSASPPPRGEGMWVGGLALALAITLTTQAAAQVIPTGSPAADILLSQAIAEHRVFLTCSALDPDIHAEIQRQWRQDTAAAVVHLQLDQAAPESIAAFAEAADPTALMPAEDTPWSEVQGLCATNPNWRDDYRQFNYTILDLKLRGAFR